MRNRLKLQRISQKIIHPASTAARIGGTAKRMFPEKSDGFTYSHENLFTFYQPVYDIFTPCLLHCDHARKAHHKMGGIFI
jgi:hypothetical protein